MPKLNRFAKKGEVAPLLEVKSENPASWRGFYSILTFIVLLTGGEGEI